MNKILTILVPIYQVELYIRQCLDSFLIPEIMDDIEVLMVNDGTRDHSAEIAAEYSENYKNTFCLVNKNNGGHGSTINVGIEQARGKYFKVVDSDDWVEKEAMVNLVTTLKSVESDIVASNYYWYDEQKKTLKAEIKKPFDGVEYNKEYLFKDICQKLFVKMHAMTIKTEILYKNKIKITEHSFYVDMEFVVFPIPYVNTVQFIDDFVYMYRIGLPNQSMNIGRMQKQIDQHGGVIDRLLILYDSMNRHTPHSCYIKNAINRMIASQYKIFLSLPVDKKYKEELMAFDKRIKCHYLDIYESQTNPYVRLLRKSKFALYPLSAYCLRLKEKIK